MFKCKRWKSILVLGISRRIVQKNHKSENNPRIENRKYCALCSVCGLALFQGMFSCGIQWECRCQLLQKYPLDTLDQGRVQSFQSEPGDSPCSYYFLLWSLLLSCCSFTQSCVTLYDPMDCSTPGFLALPGACSISCPSSQWCHPTISSSVFPFSFCLQSFPAPGSFLMSRLFISGGQSIGTSASASVLPMNIQDWFPLGLTGLISLQSKGLSRVFSSITVQKHQFFGTQPSSQSNSHIHTWPLEKP